MEIHSIILNETLLENELVILNNNEKTLFFKKENVLIEMTELQRRFMLCLLSGIYKKNDIIRAVWFCNHETVSDNNYYQMIFQCRSLLSRHGIPGEVIKTIPRFGVILSFQACERMVVTNTLEKCATTSANKYRRPLFDAVNYKVALVITLLFSVVMVVVISD
ncbi:CadC family transcriptional regulator [Pantoea ananatis]|uniref:winged helix-turn-helix domain-containing protein n=1 Tax=Pantoea ananas TaxID=553 RepID=UPI0024AD8AF1|nr:CadC family transcriptional regulator [Pantoea ananatis]MDI6539562.1 CadC family transcriptional regulator [Pantoea ananatis]